MAYSENKTPLGLTPLTSLATDDIIVIGDASDATEVAKGITKANLKTDLGLTGTNSGDQSTIVGISGTKAQFDTAVSDGNIMFDGDSITNATGTANRVFYSDNTGAITELALGADGTFLKSNGATAAPSFATPAGSGDVSKVGTPVNNQVGVWTGDGTLEGDTNLTFDTATDTLTTVNVNATTFTGALIGTASGNLVSGGTLGTPSSGTLTNCTGLPLSGVTDSTSEALGVGSIELGHATDTTISRTGAGAIAVEGVAIPTISSTNTLTNKRVTKRTGTTTSSATPAINTDNVDEYYITAQTEAITSFTTNLSGTPTLGQTLFISVIGTAARAITWGASFANGPVALPTTTVTTTQLSVLLKWDGTIWRCYATGSTV